MPSYCLDKLLINDHHPSTVWGVGGQLGGVGGARDKIGHTTDKLKKFR